MSIHENSGLFTGSTSLSFISDLISIPIDQVNFIVCQVFALILSCILKKWIKKAESRLWFSLIAGLSICYFCFGLQILHIFALASFSYIIIHMNESRTMPWILLIVSMTYLSFLHLRRQFLEPGNYSLDITGPLMVLVQKVTSLGFSVRDGIEAKKNDVKSSELQKNYAIEEKPSLLYYWSYVFQFQSMLAGPLVMYQDFVNFVQTESVPSPAPMVVKKLVQSILFLFIFVKIGPSFQVSTLKNEEFLDSMSLFTKVLYITCITTIERCKYHHAWLFADAVCNASGLGYDHKKKSWDLTTNVYPIGFELGTNLKESLDAWNIGTGKWLKYVMYERVSNPSLKTILTYLLSATWHGFYGGYYITFLSGALFTSSARTVRRYVRPHFLRNKTAKLFYDMLTWLATRVTISYVTFTFILLDFTPCVLIFTKLYFFMHVLAIMAKGLKYVVPKAPSSQPKSATASKVCFEGKVISQENQNYSVPIQSESNGSVPVVDPLSNNSNNGAPEFQEDSFEKVNKSNGNISGNLNPAKLKTG